MRFRDIPQLTPDSGYRANIPWRSVEDWLAGYQFDVSTGFASLNLDPDFQRGHVWTRAQQIAYVEFGLRGGKWSNMLRFNCTGWNRRMEGPFEIVDGKQRLEAVRAFLRDDIPAFGLKRSEFEDQLRGFEPDFLVLINNLDTRAEVLQWYLEINSGGIAHSPEEIARVQQLLEVEQAKS